MLRNSSCKNQRTPTSISLSASEHLSFFLLILAFFGTIPEDYIVDIICHVHLQSIFVILQEQNYDSLGTFLVTSIEHFLCSCFFRCLGKTIFQGWFIQWSKQISPLNVEWVVTPTSWFTVHQRCFKPKNNIFETSDVEKFLRQLASIGSFEREVSHLTKHVVWIL